MCHLLSNINGNLDSLLSNPHMNQNTILIIIYNMLSLLFIDSTWYGLLFICIFYFSITPCILKCKVSKPCYLWSLDQRENTIRGHKIGQCKGEGMLKSKVVDWFMWLSSTHLSWHFIHIQSEMVLFLGRSKFFANRVNIQLQTWTYLPNPA